MMETPDIRVNRHIFDIGIIVNFVIFSNIDNRTLPKKFNEYRKSVLTDILSGLSKNTIRRDRYLQGYRLLRERTGLGKDRYISSPEALLKYLLKNGDLPRINPLVDIYNLLSVKSRISIGAHDMEKINAHLELRLTSGDETFTPMGQSLPMNVAAGEYAYVDGDNEILCRLDHRQCHKTRITETTRSCVLIVQGNPYIEAESLDSITAELILLVNEYCGSESHIIPFSTPPG